MIVFRKFSFWIAAAGVTSVVLYGAHVHASLSAPLPQAPVAPPAKPYAQGGIAASGLVEGRGENINIGAPVSGLVTQILVQVWDEVKSGAPLFVLDDRDLRAQLLTEQATVRVAEGSLARLKDQLDRLKSVGDVRAISTDDLKTRENDVTVASLQIEAARAFAERTQLLIDRLTVRAPTSGSILQLNVRVGEYLSSQAAKAPLVLGNIAEVQVRADVDEQVAPRVKKGKKATGYIKGDTTHPIPMEFVRIEPIVVPKLSLTGASTERVDTRVLEVIFAFKNSVDRPVYVGQQMDLFIEEGAPDRDL